MHKYQNPQNAEEKATFLNRNVPNCLTGEPGIKDLACDWLNGHLFWTNQKTESIYMQAADGTSYTTVLSKSISPSELVLVPVERYY